MRARPRGEQPRVGRVVPAGFTLVEVLVALAAGGLVVLATRALFDGVGAGAARTLGAVTAADAEANGLRVARALVDQVDLGLSADESKPTDTAGVRRPDPVVGDPTVVRLTTWCATPGGWSVRCTAALRLASAAEGAYAADVAARGRMPTTLGAGAVDPAFGRSGDLGTDTDLVAELSTGERLVLRRGLSRPAFRYLVTAAGGGRWASDWVRREVPLAIAVVADADTLLLLIGPRQ